MAKFTDEMCANFKVAINHYSKSVKERFEHEAKDPWVLFVVEDSERNLLDQKIIETQLQFEHGIKSIRATFAEIAAGHKLDANNILTVYGKEIGFVYYRSGYQESQYTAEADWDARVNLECSQAVKCPSIDYHLATFKKF